MQRDVRRSIWFVAIVGGAYLAALTYFTGWQGLLLYFVAPWFAIHAWFSITTLMHHSAEDIPYLPEQYWTRNASRLLVTTDFVYPRWLLFFTHNISLHTAHHVAPSVPYYNLQKAQTALRQRYPDMVRVEKASLRPNLEHRPQMPFLRPDFRPVPHSTMRKSDVRRRIDSDEGRRGIAMRGARSAGVRDCARPPDPAANGWLRSHGDVRQHPRTRPRPERHVPTGCSTSRTDRCPPSRVRLPVGR